MGIRTFIKRLFFGEEMKIFECRISDLLQYNKMLSNNVKELKEQVCKSDNDYNKVFIRYERLKIRMENRKKKQS